MTIIVAVIVALAIIIPISLWYAFAAATLWGWFIVPFFAAPTLSTWQMWAVVLTLAAIRPKIDYYKQTREVDLEKLSLVFLSPAVSIGLGAVVKFWILAP